MTAGALGAAAADVRRGVDPALRRGEGDLRPGEPAEPGQHRRPRAAGRRPAPDPAAAADHADAPVRPRRRLDGRRRAPLHRGRQVRRAHDGRRDVPVVPRHPRREGLHPRSLPGPPGGARRRALVHGLADPAVGEALDLCLACKGCASDCPTGVDMATYKAEALHQKYAGRFTLRRPRSHLTLGRLPQWAALAAPMAPALNRMLKLGPVAKVARASAGIDQRRSIPTFAPTTLRKGLDKLDRRGDRGRRGDTGRAARRRRPRRVDLGRLVHRPLPAADRARRDPGAGGGRPGRAGDHRGRVLRPDLGHHRPARQGPEDHGAHGGHAGAVRRQRRAGRRPRAVLPGDPAQRRRRALRRPAGRRGGRRGADVGGAARARRVDAAGPHRRRGRGAAALPPVRDPRLGGGRAAAARGRRRR